jgi:hypothetical protein
MPGRGSGGFAEAAYWVRGGGLGARVIWRGTGASAASWRRECRGIHRDDTADQVVGIAFGRVGARRDCLYFRFCRVARPGHRVSGSRREGRAWTNPLRSWLAA